MEKIPNLKAPNTSRNKQTNSTLMLFIDLDTNSLNQTISKNPNLVNIIDNKGETLLSYAIRQKKVDKCQIILTSKTLDLSYQDKNGNSYLHLAILYKLEKIAQILIEKGININKQNKNGKTCLDLALINDLELIINILKAKNKDKKKEEDLKENKNNKLMHPLTKGRNTKANSKKKDKSNNNSKLTTNSTKNNNVKINVKSMKDSTTDSKNLKINLLFDYGKKSNIKKIESLPTLRDMNKTQKNEKPKVKNLSSIYFIQKTDIGKKSKYKKLVKENFNKKLTEENSISKNNNNTSGETKFKSGTNKDKKSKTNNIEGQDNLDDNQLLNLSKDDDIFGFNDSADFDKQFAITSELNKQLKKYPLLNIHHVKDFQEDDEVNIKEAYERINKKYIDEVINSSKNYNDKDSDENDNENISQIKEDDEYCVRFEDNKNSDSSEEENNGKNKSSLNILGDSLMDTVLKHTNKNNAQQKTRNINYNEPMKIQSETNRENYHYNIMNDKEFSKTIINKTQNNKNNKIPKKYSDDINNEFENQIAYHLYPEKEGKYKNNLNDLLNNQNLNIETNKVKMNDDIKEPLLLPELDKIPNDIKDNDDVVKNNCLKEFLLQINMQKYLNNFIENGFDDIKIIIEQAQKGIYIKDSELKEAGILIPGDRAKILIRIQEKAGNFKFAVPKSVYYTCRNINKVNNDINIKNFKNWLKNLRIDNYLKNFINNGYHSIELLFLQMESQSPLTAEILKEEMGIDKIGHRSRIINKLKEDGRSYINKLKTSILLVGNANNNKFCDCFLI